METQSDWKKSLRTDLEKIADHFTLDRYPKSIETQRHYEQSLNVLSERYADELDKRMLGKMELADEQYRTRAMDELDQKEREGWKNCRRPEDQFALRKGLEEERKALDPETGTYKERPDYKREIQSYVELRAQDQEKLDRAFTQVEQGLNERFGMIDRDRDREDRSR